MSKAFRCNALDTPQAYISNKKCPSQNWAVDRGQIALFGPPCEGHFFCFKYRLVGCLEHRSGMPCSSSTVISQMEHPGSRKRSRKGKKGPFGPQKTLLGAPEVLRGQRVARRGQYQVKVCGEHESNPGGPIRGSWDQIWSPGALRGPQKGQFGPKWALLGPTQLDQPVAVETKSGLLGLQRTSFKSFFPAAIPNPAQEPSI